MVPDRGIVVTATAVVPEGVDATAHAAVRIRLVQRMEATQTLTPLAQMASNLSQILRDLNFNCMMIHLGIAVSGMGVSFTWVVAMGKILSRNTSTVLLNNNLLTCLL
jgi:hypothetical protein